jgi:hypothetical protein
MARVLLLGTTIGLTLLLTPGVRAQAVNDDHSALHGSNAPAALVREVRAATRLFVNDPGAAEDAGYAPFLGCVSGTQEGAMGLHYVNGALVDDQGALDPRQPEALLYERRNGRLTLLGVEYIVKAKVWDAKNPLPPALLGQVFTYNSSPNRFGLEPFYALHVWAWRDNPHGTFVDWNPHVSCDGFSANPQ